MYEWCNVSQSGRQFSKTEGIELLKKSVMIKFARIHKIGIQSKKILKQNRAKFLGQSSNNTYERWIVNSKAIREDPSPAGNTALLQGT